MKLNSKTRIALLLVLTMMVFVSVALVACQQNAGEIKVGIPEGTYKLGNKISLVALATDGSNCALKVDAKYADLLKIDGMTITVIGDVDEPTDVTVVVYAIGNEKLYTEVTLHLVPATDGAIRITSKSGYVVDIGKPLELAVTPENGNYVVTYSTDGGETFLANCDYLSYSPRTKMLSLVTSPLQDTTVIVKFADKTNSAVFGTKEFVVKGLVSVNLSLDKTSLQKATEANPDADEANLTAWATGGAELVFATSSDLIEVVEEGKGYIVRLVSDVRFDTTATITASLKDNANISKTISVRLLQTRGNQEPVEGKNGIRLTKENLGEISNASITSTGVLSDITLTVSNGREDKNSYEMLVKMAQDRWYGAWNIMGKKLVTSDTYVKSATTVNARDESGNIVAKNVMDRLYINSQNQLASKTVKNSASVPTLWENQHLWNHLTTSYLTVDDFNFDEDVDAAALGYVSRGTSNTSMSAFKYRFDATDEQTAYLFAYIKQSLTPLAGGDDAIEDLWVIVDSEGVLGIYAKTYVESYWGTEDNTPVEGGEPVSKSWSTIMLTLSDIGTTTVADPAPYTVGTRDVYTILEKSLSYMKDSKSYKFMAVDTATRAPTVNEDDYNVSGGVGSGSTGSGSSSGSATHSGKFYDHVDSVGLNGKAATGTMGYVVANTANPFVLFEQVGKYESSMDDNIYHFTYTGYKGFTDGSGAAYYEEFAYNSKIDGFAGTRIVNADISTVLPLFNFSTALFKYDSMNMDGDREVHTFSLIDPTLTYDVVQQMSIDKQRNSASSSAENTVQISVAYDTSKEKSDPSAYTIVSTSYPYSFAGGTYAGYITTYYYGIGTTTITENEVFGNKYQQRVLPTSWAEVAHKGYYYYLHTSEIKAYPGMYDKETGKYIEGGDQKLTNSNMDTVFTDVFKDNYKYLPGPQFFLELFNDRLSGPWYDYTITGKDSAGNYTYIEEVSITVQVDNVDENKVLSNEEYVNCINAIIAKFNKWNEANASRLGLTKDDKGNWIGGWTFSKANSTALEGFAYDDVSNRRAVFTCDGLTIVIENIRSPYFYITIYNAGEWIK